MILGKLETRNFEWVTLTETTAQALENLKQAWEAHVDESDAFWSWEDLKDSVTLMPISLGDTVNDCPRCENLIHGVILCPNHGGNYDCTPFCNLCEGTQELTGRG